MSPTPYALWIQCLAFAMLASLAAPASAQGPGPTPPPMPTPAPIPGNNPPTIRPQPAPVQPPGSVTGPRAPSAGRGQRLQFTAAPLSEVIELYQSLTGKLIVRDPKVENVTVTIETSGVVPPAEAIEFIDKSLLLAGYAFVPSGNNMLKILAFEGGRIPASEGVPMILSDEGLPQTDQVVTYLLPLKYLNSEEAAQAFAQIIPPHSYGKLTPVPNAKALVITENSNTIRAYIDLTKQVDVAPGEVKHQTIHLERADAEEVAQALGELLGLGQSGGSGGGSSGGAGRPPRSGGVAPVTNPAARNGNPQQAAAMAAAQVTITNPIGGTEAEATPPKIQAIQRTNTLLVVARPLDIEYIQSLVKEYDAASPQKSFVSRKLRYLKVGDFLEVARNALLRGSKDDGGGGGTTGSTTSGGTNQTTSSTSSFGNNRSSGFGNSMDGSSGGLGGGFGGGGGSSGFGSSGSGGGGSGGEKVDVQPKSVLIGKTLVIADPSGSQFYASGPPEQLRILVELAEELDKRPRQILLTAVIGEFTLGNEFSFGVDWLRTLESVGNDGLVGGALNTTGGTLPDFTQFGGIEDFAAPQGLAVYGHIGKHLNVFLRTLEQNKRFHVLQKPTVTALNHEEASIFIGQQLAIPGQTLTQGNTGVGGASVVSTTQYVPVRLQLDITPHIYANDEIRLDFNQQNMDIASYTEISGNRIPNISEQGMKNTIIVPNKSTVMMGGLITERDTKNKSGLPFLVRVPVLKHLFGNTSNSKERRELMIFVQPHILEDGVDHLNAQAEWAQGTNSYPVNKQFADSTIDTPVETNPPPAGKGIQSPILPLPAWQGDRSGAAGVSNDLPPPISPSTAAPAPRMITKKSTSSSTKAQPPAAIPVAEEAGDAPVKQRASDRTRMLKK